MGRLIVPSSGPVYVDTNTVVYHVERTEPYYSLTSPIWDALGEGRVEVITSELTLLEVLVKPLRDGNSRLVSIFRSALLASEVRCLPIDRATLEIAANLRAADRLKTPDSIHAATALRNGSSLFLTNDTEFRKVAGLNAAILGELDSA